MKGFPYSTFSVAGKFQLLQLQSQFRSITRARSPSDPQISSMETAKYVIQRCRTSPPLFWATDGPLILSMDVSKQWDCRSSSLVPYLYDASLCQRPSIITISWYYNIRSANGIGVRQRGNRRNSISFHISG